jgi:hypothetical protein
MKYAAYLLSLCLPLMAQIRAGCTPNSVTVALATKMSVAGVWQWNCMAENIGPTTETLSMVGFALDFIELEQVNQGDVVAIFTEKQAESGWAKTGRYAGYVGLAALLVTGQGYIAVTGKIVSTVGIASYGATQLEKYAVTQEPSIANAIAGMMTSDQVLAPGAGYQWKLYASNTGAPIGPQPLALARKAGKMVKPNLRSVGPKMLTIPQSRLPHAEAPALRVIPTPPVPGDYPVTHPATNDTDVASWEAPAPEIEYVAFAR